LELSVNCLTYRRSLQSVGLTEFGIVCELFDIQKIIAMEGSATGGRHKHKIPVCYKIKTAQRFRGSRQQSLGEHLL